MQVTQRLPLTVLFRHRRELLQRQQVRRNLERLLAQRKALARLLQLLLVHLRHLDEDCRCLHRLGLLHRDVEPLLADEHHLAPLGVGREHLAHRFQRVHHQAPHRISLGRASHEVGRNPHHPLVTHQGAGIVFGPHSP